MIFDSHAQRRPGREPRRHTTLRTARQRFVCAQRRPGREPRRHRPVSRSESHVHIRSTKAGARTPATPGPPSRRSRAPSPLNEGRGANPGDTRASVRATGRATSTLNEGRGANPGDTWPSRSTVRPSCRAQRRPGREPRRHVRASVPPRGVRPPLNEGRGANPGDTHRGGRVRVEEGPRSTKAGARTPATPPRSLQNRSPSRSAQRRPGREPRRHATPCRAAGAGQALNEGRGANPGDTERPCARRAIAGPLNEGRGANPGDTEFDHPSSVLASTAQRRPGREPRRHPYGLAR